MFSRKCCHTTRKNLWHDELGESEHRSYVLSEYTRLKRAQVGFDVLCRFLNVTNIITAYVHRLNLC